MADHIDHLVPDSNVRYDVGGWISGPCLDRAPAPVVPPGSTAVREFCHAIEQALTLPAPATTRDELTYLRISRDRARVVLYGVSQILADREIDDRDIMAVVSGIRKQARQLPDDQYATHSLTL